MKCIYVTKQCNSAKYTKPTYEKETMNKDIKTEYLPVIYLGVAR